MYDIIFRNIERNIWENLFSTIYRFLVNATAAAAYFNDLFKRNLPQQTIKSILRVVFSSLAIHFVGVRVSMNKTQKSC